MLRWNFTIMAVFTVCTIAVAAAAVAPSIQIDDPWAMEQTDTSMPGMVYMKIRNHGVKSDKLIAADALIADITQIHHIKLKRQKMRMRRKLDIEIAPGYPVVLDHSGYHIMLMHLKAPLRRGTTFPLTLHFENSGPIEVEVMVRMRGHERMKGHERMRSHE